MIFSKPPHSAVLQTARRPLIKIFLSFVSVIVTTTPVLAAPSQSAVVMIATAYVQGTTHTKSLFFSHPAITSIKDCKEEVQRGYINQWRYYNPPSGRSLSAGESLRFQCVYSSARASDWVKSAPYKYTYLLQRKGDQADIKPTSNYAECLILLRKTNRPDDNNTFCTSSNQSLLF